MYGVHRTCAKTAAVSCGTSHASAVSVSTPLRWIFKKCTIKLVTHVEPHASAVSLLKSRERRIALYISNHQSVNQHFFPFHRNHRHWDIIVHRGDTAFIQYFCQLKSVGFPPPTHNSLTIKMQLKLNVTLIWLDFIRLDLERGTSTNYHGPPQPSLSQWSHPPRKLYELRQG